MKKLLIITALAAATFTSCKKDRTCTCTTTITGFGSTSSSTVIHDTKKDAKEACEKQNSASSSFGGITTGVSCELK